MGWYDGMDDEFARRLRMMIEASGGRLGVGSGFRSVEEQTTLWNNAVAKYGPEEARNWVAPPGSSNHNHGLAADLDYMTEDAQAWAHANAYKYGLSYPMEWEPWHIEPAGLRDGGYTATGGTVIDTTDAYTNPPVGHMDAHSAARRGSLAYQLEMLNSILMTPGDQMLTSPSAGMLGGISSGAQAAQPTPAAQPNEVK